MTISSMNDVGPQLDGDALDQCERRLNVRLPSAYRDFLVTWNGGRPHPSIFLIPGQGRGSVDYFFGVGREDHEYNVENNRASKAGRIPSNSIPIGEDSFGNLILLCIASEHEHSICFWDHEREGDDEGIVTVADSFEQFLEQIHEDEDD
jgi:hypothetical protein